MSLNQIQKNALTEIERQVNIIRAADVEVIPVEGGLQDAINAAPEGAVLDLISRTFLEVIVIDKPLTLRNGIIQAPPNTNDVVTLRGSHINLHDGLIIRGDLGTTKNGINNDAMFVDIDGVQVRNIARVGQESHALVMWNVPGPLSVKHTVLEAGSICFLSGGENPTIPNTIPTGLVFDDVLFTRPVEWRTRDYACKNAFELKCAQDVVVKNSVLENVWTQGQTGSAIVLTPAQYGNSPETIVQNVLFDNNVIRNAGNGVNALGFTQKDPVQFPTRRGNNYKFINNEWQVTRTLGSQGALVMLGNEPNVVEFTDETVIADGDAFLRVSDKKPIMGFKFLRNSVNKTGTYGVFTPIGNRGAGWLISFPDGVMEGNTFYSANSIFKSNFPNNTYLT